MAAEQENLTVSVDTADRAGIEDAEAGAPQDLTDADAGSDGASAATDASDQDQPDAAEARIAALEEELQDAREHALRLQAEMQNIHRRAERDVENAHKFALEKFSAALLPILDNLERAQAAMNPDEEQSRPLLEGIELTQRSFLDVMRRFNVETIDPMGEPFDPSRHEAMSMIPNDEVEPNTVVQVVQKGYSLNGRVLRAAMVLVSRPGEAASKVDETV